MDETLTDRATTCYNIVPLGVQWDYREALQSCKFEIFKSTFLSLHMKRTSKKGLKPVHAEMETIQYRHISEYGCETKVFHEGGFRIQHLGNANVQPDWAK